MPQDPQEERRQSIPWFSAVQAILGVCVLFFIIVPLVGLLFSSSLSELRGAVSDEEITRSIWLTLTAAMVATIACTVTGIPLAYLLARKKFFGRTAILAIIDLPIIIPHSAAGIALLTVIGRHSLFAPGDGLVGTFAGITVAMAFVSVPFLINAARAGFAAVPQRLEKAARTLGASPCRVFFTISLPMAWRDVFSGMILMWGRGISEFGAVIIIAYYPMTTPVLVFQRFNDYGLAHARAAAVLLVVICVALFAVFRFAARQPRTEGG